MLGWRLTISAILIPTVIGLFVLDARLGPTAPVLAVTCLVLGLRSVWEMVVLLRVRSFAPSLTATTLATIAVIATAWFRPPDLVDSHPLAELGPLALTYALAVITLFVAAAMRYREPGSNMESLAAEILTVSYVGVLLSMTVRLRWVAGSDAGYLVLGSVIIAAKCGDIGAYTLGRLFGKRKMIPRLSPGKTWMGAVGAVVGASAGSVTWLQLAPPIFNPAWIPCAWFWALLFGAILGVVGLVGDLCESLIKRDVGQKDSAPLMPGFGGLLDLLDSILFAGPVAWLLWIILPLAHS